MGQYAFYIFLGFAFVIFLFYQCRKKLWFQQSAAYLLLKLPIFGAIFKSIFLSRLCQSFYLLLNSNVPLLQTVGLTKQMISFFPIQQSLLKAEEDIVQGQMLYHSLAQSSFYPQRFLALVKVGEESSSLDTIFQKMSTQLNEEVEQRTALISNLLEPVLIVVIGVLVGVILVAMYMPLFQLSIGIGNS